MGYTVRQSCRFPRRVWSGVCQLQYVQQSGACNLYLSRRRITGNIFPLYFNDRLSAWLSVCVCPPSRPHVGYINYWMFFLRHNVLIQPHFIQPYNESLQSRQRYSPAYFGTAWKCVRFQCICPSSWVTSLMEQQLFVWGCHRRWVMEFGENTLLLNTHT